MRTIASENHHDISRKGGLRLQLRGCVHTIAVTFAAGCGHRSGYVRTITDECDISTNIRRLFWKVNYSIMMSK